MKVTISKGPNFKKAEAEAYRCLYEILSKQTKATKEQKSA